MEVLIELEYLIPIIGLISPPAFFIARYFWKKEKCFVAMQNKIDYLSSKEQSSDDEHDGFDGRLTEIEKRQQKNETYLKLLLDHENIQYHD